MSATKSSPEDLAKALLLQAALARKGVSAKAIADAVNKLTRSGTVEALARSIQKALEEGGAAGIRVTPKDVMNAMALAKLMAKMAAAGKDGLKEIMSRIKDGSLGGTM